VVVWSAGYAASWVAEVVPSRIDAGRSVRPGAWSARRDLAPSAEVRGARAGGYLLAGRGLLSSARAVLRFAARRRGVGQGGGECSCAGIRRESRRGGGGWRVVGAGGANRPWPCGTLSALAARAGGPPPVGGPSGCVQRGPNGGGGRRPRPGRAAVVRAGTPWCRCATDRSCRVAGRWVRETPVGSARCVERFETNGRSSAPRWPSCFVFS